MGFPSLENQNQPLYRQPAQQNGFPSLRDKPYFPSAGDIASNKDIAKPLGLNIRGDNEPVTMLQLR